MPVVMETSENYEFKSIEHGSQEYAAEVRLRDAVLRSPLRLRFSQEELSSESGSYHLGCYLQGRLLACLVLEPMDHARIKMRQVAVEPVQQGQGIGRALVFYSEQFAKELGYRRMVLHARKTAIGFYERLDYLKQGEEFTEVTIPHWEMVKNL